METTPERPSRTPSNSAVPMKQEHTSDPFEAVSETSSTAVDQRTHRLSFARDNGPVDVLIAQLMQAAGGIRHLDLIREMMLAGLKAGQENHDRADLKLMLSTLKEMRFTSKVFAPYRHVKKVSVFGSARIQRDSVTCGMARLLGKELARSGCMVITGGGQGVMEAVNEGAGNEHSFGVCIRLPFEKQPNQVLEGSPRIIIYKYFFNRKVAFVKETDAVVVFPGGFGTLDETMEILTLLQTGKRTPIPLVLMDEPGGSYWAHWITFMQEELASRGYICEKDFSLFDRADSVDEAVRIIHAFYRRYHSMRFVGEQLVIRMHSPLEPQIVDRLTRDFSDLLLPGGRISSMGIMPEEPDEETLHHLERLVIDFNRRAFGRLKQLVDAINAA